MQITQAPAMFSKSQSRIPTPGFLHPANTQKFATMLSATKVFVESARSFALYLSNQTVRNSMRSLVHPWSDRSSAFGVHGSTAG